jgi:hypothetical protein
MIESELEFFSDLDGKNKLWQDCKQFIEKNCVNDPLYNNYLNLDNKKFLFFNGLIHCEKIISFGGIEYSPSKWGIDIARVLTRFWIHPDYRSQGLTKWSKNKLRFSPIILRKQLDFLKSQPHIKVAMITREGEYNKSFLEIVRLSSSVSDDSFEIISGLHKLDRRADDNNYQMIALSSLSKETNKVDVFSKAKKLGFFKSHE